MEACSGDNVARRRRQAAEGVWAPKKNGSKAASVKKGHRIFLTVRNPFFLYLVNSGILKSQKKQKKKGKSNMERREKRMMVTGKHILLKGILGVYSLYAFAVLVMRLISYRPLPLPLLWIGEAGFAVSLMLLPNAVDAEDPKKDEIFFGSMLLLFGILLVVGAAGVF